MLTNTTLYIDWYMHTCILTSSCTPVYWQLNTSILTSLHLCISTCANLYTVWPKKSDNKAGWVLARMFFIVGARLHRSCIGRKEVLHAWFVSKLFITFKQYFGDAESPRHNCDIAGKLGVAPPNVRKTIQRFQELGHTGDRPINGRKRIINSTRNSQLNKKRVQRNSTVSLHKLPVKPVSRRIAKQDLKLKGSTSDVWQQASTIGKKSTPSSRMKSYSPSIKPTIIRKTGAGSPRLQARLLSSSTAKIQHPRWFRPEFLPGVRPLWFSSMSV